MFYVVTVKSMVEISQNFVAFSEYMNFTTAIKNNTLLVFMLKPWIGNGSNEKKIKFDNTKFGIWYF